MWLTSQVWAPLAGASLWLWASSAPSFLRCCLLPDLTAHHHSPQAQSAQHGSVAVFSHSIHMVAVQLTPVHDDLTAS